MKTRLAVTMLVALIVGSLGNSLWAHQPVKSTRPATKDVALVKSLNAMVTSPVGKQQDENKLSDQVRAILEKAEHFELLSLDPDNRLYKQSRHRFYGYKVLGKTVIKDRDVSGKVLDALKKGIEESEEGSVTFCFSPRHGIRATFKGKTVDLVICFHCHRMDVYIDGNGGDLISTTGSAELVFDQVLIGAKVRLAKKED